MVYDWLFILVNCYIALLLYVFMVIVNITISNPCYNSNTNNPIKFFFYIDRKLMRKYSVIVPVLHPVFHSADFQKA
jgi:hypothetical protein